MFLNLQEGHQKCSGALVYSACCRSKSLKQYMHFISLGHGLPIQAASLGRDGGPNPILFLSKMLASYRTPGRRPITSISLTGGRIGSVSSACGKPVFGGTLNHSRPPTDLTFTKTALTGGTVVGNFHFTRIFWLPSRDHMYGSLGTPGTPGSFNSPIQAGLLSFDSAPHLPITKKLTTASYSIPSSKPFAKVSCAGAGIAVPPTKRQFWSPTRRSFTIVCFASCRNFQQIFILPSPAG
mmetsp:Transcript_93944/g.148451  ORF Transcript_93944/g.148451 Transcript_93944/m.148451 type:complete len:238 (+) Transcript_93944:474-1187(+)